LSSYFIDYGKLIDDAMHVIVKQALGFINNGVLPGKHHFFISFLTSHPGVKISKALKDKYPEEMTIVLQHQFEGLHVEDKFFSVILSFDNVKENIVIPFDSLIAFADPSVKFGLQFSHMDGKEDEGEEGSEQEKSVEEDVAEGKTPEKTAKKGKGKGVKDATPVAANNVVDIDAFRKK
jgi:hypothetical protein